MCIAYRLLKTSTTLLTAWLLICNLAWSAPPIPPPFVSDQVLVAFRPGTPAADISAAHNRAGGQVLKTVTAIGVQIVSIPAGTVLDRVQLYRRNPNVEYAEPNYLRPLIMPVEGSFGQGINVFDEQWTLHNQGTALQTYVDPATGLPGWQYTRLGADIDATEAWDIEKGDANVWVAVPDSGVDCNHGDLVGKCMHEEDHVTPTVDSFGNPIPDLVDQLGHGTHVAGTIAMQTNNGNGGAGVGWNTSIGSFKVCYMENFLDIIIGSSCQDADIASAITRATDLGYDVINMSFGQAAPSQVVQDALDYASAAGVVLVAAAGNAFDDRAGFSTFSVDDDFDPGTQNDDWVDVLAPGDPVLSTVPTNFCSPPDPQCFKWLMGTSMAAPHVSGVAALVKSYLNLNDPPNANATEVRRRIQDCADATGAMDQNMLAWSKFGRLNAAGALTCGDAPPPPVCTRNAPGLSLGGDRSIAPDGSAVYTLNITNNDSATCADATFDLSILSETGDTGNFSLPSVLSTARVTLAAGASSNTETLTVSGNNTGADGNLLDSSVEMRDDTDHGGQQQSDSVRTTITAVMACSVYTDRISCQAANCKWKRNSCQAP
jgi:thermitase